jgi:GNAT superfamily N-acetyltransferase
MTLVIDVARVTEAIRPAGPDDAADLVAMHERCSRGTRFRRWHGHTNVFPQRYLHAVLTGADGHLALVARRGRRLVGLASAAVVAPGVRELGILVEDEWQHRGVGGELLTGLLAEIRRCGGYRVRADILVEDAGLLAPLAGLGTMTTRRSFGVITAVVDLH